MKYEEIGYDSRLRKNTALKTTIIKATDFDVSYQVQTNQLNASKVNLIDFAKIAPAGTALGTFNANGAGSILYLQAELGYLSPNKTVRTFGRPVIAIYEGAGTVAINQIYPYLGTSVDIDKYRIIGGVSDFADYNGTADQWHASIIISPGTTVGTITFAGKWLYLDYVTGVGEIQ